VCAVAALLDSVHAIAASTSCWLDNFSRGVPAVPASRLPHAARQRRSAPPVRRKTHFRATRPQAEERTARQDVGLPDNEFSV
jgi:hypothetical protein